MQSTEKEKNNEIDVKREDKKMKRMDTKKDKNDQRHREHTQTPPPKKNYINSSPTSSSINFIISSMESWKAATKAGSTLYGGVNMKYSSVSVWYA